MKYKRILFFRAYFDPKDSRHPRDINIPFTIGYAARLLEDKHYKIKLIDNRIKKLNIKNLIRESSNWNPDIIFLYTEKEGFIQLSKYIRILKKIKREILAVGIGPLVSLAPSDIVNKKTSIDMGLLGESELSILKLLEKVNNKKSISKIKNLYTPKKTKAKSEIIKDLDKLPFPKHELFNPLKYKLLYPLHLSKKVKFGHVLSSRGCPYNCIFCSQIIRESYGRRVRLRSAKNVVDEIEELLSLGVNLISFEDDCFTVSKKHVINICNEINKRKLDIKWTAHARIDEVDKEMLKEMKKSGCILLRFGVESGSNRIIKLLKKTNKKIDWVEKTKEVFHVANEIGFSTAALFIIGNPTETEKEIYDSIALAKEINPDMVQVHFFTPYKGSEAYKLYKNKIKNNNFYHYSFDINLSNIPDVQLKELQKKFYKTFYFNPTFFINHYKKYGLFYLNNPIVWKKLASYMISL